MDIVPKVGERVIIPFGGYDVEAEVVRISDIFTPPMVEVEFFLDEQDDEPARSLYSIDRIRPVPVAAG